MTTPQQRAVDVLRELLPLVDWISLDAGHLLQIRRAVSKARSALAAVDADTADQMNEQAAKTAFSAQYSDEYLQHLEATKSRRDLAELLWVAFASGYRR